MGNRYKLLKDYETPTGAIRAGVVKYESNWCEIFEHLDLKPSELLGKTDWFEKVEEERIELYLNSGEISRKDGKAFTYSVAEVMEKAINEELVTKKGVLGVLLNAKEQPHLMDEYNDIPDFRYGYDTAVNFIKRQIFPEDKTTEVPISDCGSETVSYNLETQSFNLIDYMYKIKDGLLIVTPTNERK